MQFFPIAAVGIEVGINLWLLWLVGRDWTCWSVLVSQQKGLWSSDFFINKQDRFYNDKPFCCLLKKWNLQFHNSITLKTMIAYKLINHVLPCNYNLQAKPIVTTLHYHVFTFQYGLAVQLITQETWYIHTYVYITYNVYLCVCPDPHLRSSPRSMAETSASGRCRRRRTRSCSSTTSSPRWRRETRRTVWDWGRWGEEEENQPSSDWSKTVPVLTHSNRQNLPCKNRYHSGTSIEPGRTRGWGKGEGCTSDSHTGLPVWHHTLQDHTWLYWTRHAGEPICFILKLCLKNVVFHSDSHAFWIVFFHVYMKMWHAQGRSHIIWTYSTV